MDTPEEETARQMTNAVVYTVLRQDSVEEEDSEMLQAITEIENGQDEDITVREVSEKIRYIADMVNAHIDPKLMEQLQECIDKKTFERVADDFKGRGGMNSWGGVATLICISCKAAKMVAKVSGIAAFKRFIGWTVDYVQEKLVPWIMSVGGWVAVLGLRSTSTGMHTVGIFLTGALGGSAIVYILMK